MLSSVSIGRSVRTALVPILCVLTAIILAYMVPQSTYAANQAANVSQETPASTPESEATALPTAMPEPENESSSSQSGSTQASQSAISVSSSAFVPFEPVMSSQPVSVTITGGDDAEALGVFLRYLLVGYGIQTSQVTVTIGALPAELPIEVPLPADMEVFGGYVRRGEYDENQIFVTRTAGTVADGEDGTQAGAAKTALDEIRQHLLDNGFSAPPNEMLSGATQVFLPTTHAIPNILCGPNDEITVSMGAILVAGQPDAVRITLNRQNFGDPCSEVFARRAAGDSIFEILPQLSPPADSTVRPHGTSTSGDGVDVDAQITTELTATQLAEHYESQLVDAGWENLDRSSANAIAWSVWRFTDGEDHPWTATFSVTQQGTDETSFEATLSAQRQR